MTATTSSQSHPGSTGPASSTASWNTRPPSTSAAHDPVWPGPRQPGPARHQHRRRLRRRRRPI